MQMSGRNGKVNIQSFIPGLKTISIRGLLLQTESEHPNGEAFSAWGIVGALVQVHLLHSHSVAHYKETVSICILGWGRT